MTGLTLLYVKAPDACLHNPDWGGGIRDGRKSLAYSRALLVPRPKRTRNHQKKVGNIAVNGNLGRQAPDLLIVRCLLPYPVLGIRQAPNLLLPDTGETEKEKSAVALTNVAFMISYPRVCVSQRLKGLARLFGNAHKRNVFSPMGR